MNDRELEARLRAWYHAEAAGDETAPISLRRDVVEIPQTPTNRHRWFRRGRGLTLLAAAALLLVGGAMAAGSGLVRLPSLVPPESSPTSVTSPAPTETSSSVPARAASWIATGTMATPRNGHTAVRLLDGRVLIAGGSGDLKAGATFGEALTSAELYDPDSGTWSATGNMLHPKAGFPATLLRDGKVLVGDVRDANPGDRGSGTRGAEVYDPATGTWSSTGKRVTTAGMTATLLANGKVLVSGLDGSEVYDPDSGTWTATGKMVTPRYSHAAALLPDGRVLAMGGDVIPDHALNSAELYDPATGTWTAIATMSAPRDSITATLLRDGMVLVVGGVYMHGASSAELYDPATGAWTTTHLARPNTSYSSSTLLSDGTVLVASSGNYADPAWPGSTAAELYEPGSRAWATTADMLRGHDSASATLLADGTVLVAGGIDCRGDPGCKTGATGSAELYVPAGVPPPPAVAAIPIPTPSPIPIPTPTPVPPAVGPIPPGARPWTVTVVNQSPRSATLFVAEEDENGMTRLVGSVTPNVVPPGATVKVTFHLPAERVKGWWIFVNPGRGTGALLGWNEVPLAGEIRIGTDGQPVWSSP